MQQNNSGFTLLEAMISLLILAVGIMGVATMQVQAINGNSSGIARTSAVNLGRSFIEELRRLPMTDPTNLVDNAGAGNGIGGLNIGSDLAGIVLNPALADRFFAAAEVFGANNFPNFVNTYQLNNGFITDNGGRNYQVFWNVAADPGAVGVGPPPYYVISLFVYWNTNLNGQNHVQLTSLKYQ